MKEETKTLKNDFIDRRKGKKIKQESKETE